MPSPEREENRGLAAFLESEDDELWSLDEISESSIFERYTNARLIATGGMKEIYEVYDVKTCHTLALAQLKDGGPYWHCEAFMKEAYLTARLDHPNIISVYDVGVKAGDEPYFTMALKVGDTLSTLLGKENVSLNELLQVFLKVCDAVSYAHSQEVLHLDIKPDNIQVGEFGEVKLCDWGLASPFKEANNESVYIKGTPGYMSPEQATQDEIDVKTDIYALGAILYSMLVRDCPVEGTSKQALTKTSKGDILFPIERFPEKQIPLSLDAVVRKAMCFEKGGRYIDVAELRGEVENFLTGRSTVAEDAGFFKEVQLFYRRNKQTCSVVLFSLLIICFLTFVFFWNIQKSKDETEKALADLKVIYNDLEIAKEKEKEAFLQSERNYQKYIAKSKEEVKLLTQLKLKDLEAAYASVVYPIYYNDPVQAINNSLLILKRQQSLNPDSEIEQQIIINLFISQNFTEVLNFQATYTAPLVPLAEKYALIEKGEKGTLSNSDFVSLLKEINAFGEEGRELKNSLIERMVYYYIGKRQTYFVHNHIVLEVLKSFNPNWDSENFKYDKKNRRINLTGRGLRRLNANSIYSSHKCILSLLNVIVVDLRGSGVGKLFNFEGLKVSKLDVRNTRINSVHPFSALKGISRLCVNKGQIPDDLIEILPSTVTLIVSE